MVGQGLGGQSGTWMGELECTPDGEGHSRGESAEKDGYSYPSRVAEAGRQHPSSQHCQQRQRG